MQCITRIAKGRGGDLEPIILTPETYCFSMQRSAAHNSRQANTIEPFPTLLKKRMKSLQNRYQLNEILVPTLLVLPELAGFQLIQPIPGMNWEIA